MKSTFIQESVVQLLEDMQEVIEEHLYDTTHYLSIFESVGIPVFQKEEIKEILVENTGDEDFARAVYNTYMFFNSSNVLFENTLLKFINIALEKKKAE